MSRRDFRVKVDLSKFYDDVRRSSWIYVDKESISCIYHLQTHITKLFNMEKPFHLLLKTGEYLPPNEDARILQDDETILVIPGTGLGNDAPNPPRAESKANGNGSRSVSQKQQGVLSDLNVSSKAKVNESSEEKDTSLANASETTSENTILSSMINDSHMETETESKPDLNALDEDALYGPDPNYVRSKRKRVRRKRSKNATATEESIPNAEDSVESKKLKILNSVTITNEKHLRFGDFEEVEVGGYDSYSSNHSKKQDPKSAKNVSEDFQCEKAIAGSNLENLLALRQSSTPITFGRPKIAEEPISWRNIETPKANVMDDFSLTVDPKRHPLMKKKARLHDIIAFKMLKMGSDYTPQVSNFIIATPIQIMDDKATYIFKILEGLDEVIPTQGKFDIVTEETENTETESDVITLNWVQLFEPRLMHPA